MSIARSGPDRVVSLLEGSECEFCSQGDLTEGTYEGGPAVVCDHCDVPQVRF